MIKRRREMPGKTRRDNFLLLFITLVIVVFLDQMIKYAVRSGAIPMRFITNSGSAFGALRGFNFPLILVAVAFIIVVIFMYRYIPNIKILFFSVGLVLGGTVGNLIDRLYLGHVVDFIQLWFWRRFPLFNVADSAIVIGACLFIFFYVKWDHEEYLRTHTRSRARAFLKKLGLVKSDLIVRKWKN